MEEQGKVEFNQIVVYTGVEVEGIKIEVEVEDLFFNIYLEVRS
jgi:hypothetical protein